MKKAFSLVELIIVVGIIGVLSSILIASFSGGTESARAAKCLNNLRNLAQGAISYGMKEDYYPAAGSFGWLGISESTGDLVACEVRGWISWFSKGDPYHRTHDTGNPPKTFQKCSTVAACCSDEEASTFALTNGCLWLTLHSDRDVYVCPEHLKNARSKSKAAPKWSYVMNAYFGYDETNGSDFSTAGCQKFGGSRMDRILMFTELPFAMDGSSDGSTSVSEDQAYSNGKDQPLVDGVLQYKATVNGKSYNTSWSGAPEAIQFNHRSGKRDYNAHVAFADGHVEKLRKPRGSSSGLNAVQLTALLCEGVDVSFNGSSYDLIKDGDESGE